MGVLRNNRRDLLIALLLVIVTVAVFWQAASFDYINYDDGLYVQSNPSVLAGLSRSGIHWAMTTGFQSLWQPLVWISYMTDAQAGKWMVWLSDGDVGQGPALYHTVNVLWHVIDVVLLFVILNVLTRKPWRSAFVAALFAIHPLHVESVVWIAERKDVTELFLLAAYDVGICSPSRTSGSAIIRSPAAGIHWRPYVEGNAGNPSSGAHSFGFLAAWSP